MKKLKKESRGRMKGHLWALGLTGICYGVMDYLFLPPYNVKSATTWIWVTAAFLGFGTLDLLFQGGLILSRKMGHRGQGETVSVQINPKEKKRSLGKLAVMAGLCLMAVYGILALGSSPIFNAKRYARIAGPIEARDFSADTPNSETISDIALMDTESARIIGARALGTLEQLVSQFELSDQYTQINQNGKAMKVSPLQYADFFKWLSNRGQGVPGYVAVDPVANTSDYVPLTQPMKYSASGYLNDNLYRKLRFSYRTALFGDSYFEIDEEGNPYYITAVLDHEIFLFGGETVKGVVTLNPSTGETRYYDIQEVPSWIDIVYSGDRLTRRYDWYGLYSGGYWNSLVGNKDCKQVTDDFGYKMFDDDVWVFTGVTSVVSDESNIGFVLMNSRTAEIRYYPIPGAEEYSVMASAEGEVQHLGYRAAFPSVIKVADQPTYIMVLKDKGGLVKQYALIHVERYNIVATAETQQAVITKYKAALAENGILPTGADRFSDDLYETVTVAELHYLVLGGNSYAYLLARDGRLLKVDCSQFEAVVRVKPGDKLSVVLDEAENELFPVIALTMD